MGNRRIELYEAITDGGFLSGDVIPGRVYAGKSESDAIIRIVGELDGFGFIMLPHEVKLVGHAVIKKLNNE